MRWPTRAKRGRRRLQAKVDQWNRLNPVGTVIKYRNDFGKWIESKTRSAAWVLNSENAVIMIEGRSGGYDLERILPTPAAVR